jgi:hypothetical protein
VQPAVLSLGVSPVLIAAQEAHLGSELGVELSSSRDVAFVDLPDDDEPADELSEPAIAVYIEWMMSQVRVVCKC